MNDNTDRRHIVVIGGGFAGLQFLKHIDKKKYSVTLVDTNNYHSFPPLFYQIASSGIEPAGICFPIRAEIQKYISAGVRFRMMKVGRIDPAANTVHGTKGESIRYDILVIAAGTTNNFFNIPGLQELVFTLKSTPEALRTRNEVLSRLEKGASESNPEARKKLLNFVVVGGGPTGVETAGALGEMKRYILKRQYPELKPEDVNITLIEGSDRLLGTMSGKSSVQAMKYLKELEVDVRTGIQMKGYDGETITTDAGDIAAGMVIWTAGVTTVPFEFSGKEPVYGRGHRISVNEWSLAEGFDNIYALGDISIMTSDPAFPQGHPQLAQVAIQQARLLAKNLNRQDKAPKGFIYNDKGSMATVGRNRAVVDLPHLHFGGFSAWLTWMFIHLMSILGTRNKITVLINWAWGYFTYGSSLRMLFKVSRQPELRPEE